MTWDLSNLLELQAKLDINVFKKCNQSYASTIEKRQMALIIELAELANELRFFKFWSKKKQSPDEIVLDELADVFHFALTFAVQFKLTCKFEIVSSSKEFNIIASFKKLMVDAQTIKDEKSTLNYLKYLLTTAVNLGFSKKQIVAAYMKKNQVNLERAASNY
ncbi:dUTP diphosphatase [[Mycoplasma] testudinis]|uniref:dUTP diphosphatase n=1 Tax=[Mycoplasma] testudinis TaxID=33924 RepID=UPI00048875F1|nr:dUTP diphosphatase [[Mycoplasma] testudinis]